MSGAEWRRVRQTIIVFHAVTELVWAIVIVSDGIVSPGDKKEASCSQSHFLTLALTVLSDGNCHPWR
jgi:hypothetical protein